MNGHIPNIVKPYPDEILFSWIGRLANANGLSLEVFFKTYFGEKSVIKEKLIPVDIRKGFLDFCEALNCNMDNMDLYFQMSTAQFELSFYPPKQQTRILHIVTRPENKLNTSVPYFIAKPKVCLKCMKEDIERYGEAFLHRSHHLSGVKVCHKHGTILHEVHKLYRNKYAYDFKNSFPIAEKITSQDIEYSKYAHYLLSNNIMTTSDDILHIILQAMNPQGELTRIQIAENISKILDAPTKKNKWTRQDVILPPEDTIRILMYLYPNPEDFLANLKRCNLVIKKHCKKCNKDYYTTQYAIDMGWNCVYCDSKLSEQKLFERLVHVGSNNEYELKTPFQGLGKKVTLFHKACEKDFPVTAGRFLFQRTRCNCNQRLLRRNADKIMKKYPDFKLIDFSGAALPATFLHNTCGQTFEVKAFRDFVEIPKCRCCEVQHDITQKEFEKRVRDVVGDEYTVVGEVITLATRIAIRHNSCGHIHEFKPYEFLAGSRCPKCYQKTSKKKLEVMLQEYSDGRYELVGHDNFRFILQDNKTKAIIKLKGNHIVQEIIRPTPSTILPVDKGNKVSESLTTWDRWYKLCVAYKNEHGHLVIGNTEKYNGHALGDWCSYQRISYNKGELSEDKVKSLEDIGFIFNYALYAWNQRFDEYKAYVKETGNYFPRTDCIHNGNKVGSWFLGQRKERKRGKLNPEFEKILLEYYPDFFKDRVQRKAK